jgi:hypothetical protein
MSWRSSKVIDAKAVMAKYYGRYGFLSPDEAEEFEAAYKKLKEAQKMCSHNWDFVPTFTSVVEQCRWCDLPRSEYDGGWNR